MKLIGCFAFAAYTATIPAANWMVGNLGECIPGGPCLIPVGLGLMAPSGVLMIGAALVLRDTVHSLLGWQWAVTAILFGVAVSAAIAPPALVLASAAAFLLSELADLAIYAPLRRKRLALAVAASGAVGAVIDSAVFLLIAFGSLDFVTGQIVGKLWMSLAAGAALIRLRRGAVKG